jgi:hypothetical protein
MEEQFPKKTTPSDQPSIIAQAHAFILQRFNQLDDARLVYHNYSLATEIVENAKQILANTKTNASQQENVLLAAWFYCSGYFLEPSTPRESSVKQAQQFMKVHQLDDARVQMITEAIDQVHAGRNITSLTGKILADAVNATLYSTAFAERDPLHHLEWELLHNERFSKEKWATLQLQLLLKVKFYTHFAKLKHERALAQNILQHRALIEKLNSKQSGEDDGEGQLRLYQDLEKKMPARAVQTYFRANYRNHINLSAIADNKANIMISVNTILISVLITFLSYRNIGQTQPIILMPVIIFLVTGLASLIFAVLSARPKVTNLAEGTNDLEVIKKNVIFFGNFSKLSLQQYEEAMDAVYRDGELMYGNMTRDLYYLGKALDKKYRFLSISYNIFMVGFIFTVTTFLVALFV